MGISVSLPTGGDPTFGFTYFVADNLALRADLGLNITSANGAAQQFSVEGGLRYYFASFEHFMPFVQPGVYVNNPAGAAGGNVIDLAVEAGLGGEYFITNHFSFGAMTGVALNMKFDPTVLATFTTGTSSVFGQFLW